MYRLTIDLRTSAGSLKEEHQFESKLAAETYYLEVRDNYGRGTRVESRSIIMQFLGGAQMQVWSVCKHFEENVKREFVRWKK